MFRKRQVQRIHPVKAKYHRWDCQNDGDNGQLPHYDVDIVRDDRTARIHHVGKNAGINACHFFRLF